MITDSKQLDVDLWEAWIDTQTVDSLNCPTLYVVGDVFINDKISRPYFIRRESSNPKVLTLQILPDIATEEGYITEILYAEELDSAEQYESILVYFQNELITQITDIERTC